MNNELNCYIGKDVRMNLCDEDEKIKTFKDEYRVFLNILWEYSNYGEKWSGSCSGTGPYVDPDKLAGNGNKRINTEFYSDLKDFLNKSEKNYKGDKDAPYTYDNDDKYIRNKNVGVELVSDQFGFSAPSLKLSHPYDIYLKKCKEICKNKEDKAKAIDNVIKWVMESRTIGGSFLWPRDIWVGYNVARGGSIKRKSYIEDRVDLTLLEIKHYLDNLENNTKEYIDDILYKCIDKESVGGKWIASFEGFKGYVKYFCFKPFVDDNYMPYDIVESNIVNGNKKAIEKVEKKDSIFDLGKEELEKMFNNVNYMIKERSHMMIERSKSESSHSD